MPRYDLDLYSRLTNIGTDIYFCRVGPFEMRVVRGDEDWSWWFYWGSTFLDSGGPFDNYGAAVYNLSQYLSEVLDSLLEAVNWTAERDE